MIDLRNTRYSFQVNPPTFFCPENVVCILCLLHFIKEANTMKPNPTAPLQSDLDPYCCNKGYLRILADRKVGDKSPNWQVKG